MPLKEIDFGPVSHLTTDAIGKPGERVFLCSGYLGRKGHHPAG